MSWPENVRESAWGPTENKKLHSWAFDRLYQYLAYKGEARGVEVVKENEWDTSKTCSQCGENVDPSHVYCPNCGEKTAHRVFCDCGDELRSDWAFCPSCGRRTPAADVLDQS